MAYNVLIVDDNAIIQMETGEYLSRSKAVKEVQGADHPRAALDILAGDLRQGKQIDTLVLDMQFGDHSGMDFDDLIDTIRESTPHGQPQVFPEIIFMSGNDRDDIANHIAHLQDRYPQFVFSGLMKGSAETLRHYLESDKKDTSGVIKVNPEWRRISSLFPPLDFNEAAVAATDKDVPWSGIIFGLDPEDVLRAVEPRVDVTERQERDSLVFEKGSGPAITGLAVFTLKEAAQLRASGHTGNIILITSRGSNALFRNTQHINGVVNIGEIATHFRNIMRSAGISTIASSRDFASDFNVKLKRGVLTTDELVITSGMTITIDPVNAMLYEGEAVIHNTPPRQALYDIGQAVEGFTDYRRPSRDQMRFLIQADTHHDLAVEGASTSEIGLSRMEYYFVHGKGGMDILRGYLFDPNTANREKLKTFLARYIKEEIESKSYYLNSPFTFRLFDMKPDELLSQRDADALKAKYGLTDLRGTALASVLPDFYQAQVEALLEAIPAEHTIEDRCQKHRYGLYVEEPSLNIAIPMVKDGAHFDYMSGIVNETVSVMRGPDYPWVKAIPMIESLEAIRNLPAILESMRYGILMIGTSDLMSDIMGGVDRNDEKGIQAWMEKQGNTNDHPFRTVTPSLRRALEDIRDCIRQSEAPIYMRVCGEHAQHLDALLPLNAAGVHEVCVPATIANIAGLPLAFDLATLRKEPPSQRTIEHMYQSRQRRGLTP
ncbi:MAG: response regulator [Proteobacteria bacterium]|nr:response regulator [Pseudomonadota bacterium]